MSQKLCATTDGKGESQKKASLAITHGKKCVHGFMLPGFDQYSFSLPFYTTIATIVVHLLAPPMDSLP